MFVKDEIGIVETTKRSPPGGMEQKCYQYYQVSRLIKRERIQHQRQPMTRGPVGIPPNLKVFQELWVFFYVSNWNAIFHFTCLMIMREIFLLIMYGLWSAFSLWFLMQCSQWLTPVQWFFSAILILLWVTVLGQSLWTNNVEILNTLAWIGDKI